MGRGEVGERDDGEGQMGKQVGMRENSKAMGGEGRRRKEGE